MLRKGMQLAVRVAYTMAALLVTTYPNAPAATVELRVVERQGVARVAEPVTFAVPFPKGDLHSAEQVRLLRDGQEVPAQFRAAGLWRPEESIRWLLVDLRTDLSHEVRLADGTIVVSQSDGSQPRHGAVVRGLKTMVTRAIPAPANRGRSHLISVTSAPQAGLEDDTLRFASAREYEVTGAKSGRVGKGAYSKDFSSTDGMVSIPADAWLPYAYPAEGDVYTFRTIPAGYSTSGASVNDSTILERGPLRSVIRVRGFLGSADAPVLEYTAWYHFHAGSGRVKLVFALESNNHGGRTSTGNARNADIGGINRPISLWASLFYMEALARYVETFPDDAAARAYFLAHAETLRKSADPEHEILYTITPQSDGSVVGRGTCSHYNILAADVLSLAYRLTGRTEDLAAARRCFAYGVQHANGEGGGPTYYQVHSANGALHGNVFMAVEKYSQGGY